ncbi:MAG: GntG family PLP-dependent aldolase [Saprospiraceae bacterium]|nr:GntG family PLP-dependent aldolase [Saprospiraceae bacterium]MDZ4706722.1 GntG family PLP-dependent aldolase [Saprospiraceae bacterium]
MFVNLISDTVTKPTPAMLQAMFQAEVGDDVFGEDPTVRALEMKAAALFQKEAALFCPSGTMTNQIAVKVHTQPLDEIVLEETSHVYQYETGGYAFHSGVAVNLLYGVHGKITATQVAAAIKPLYDWLPRTRLVVLENTCNKGGGSYYTFDEMQPISALCRERGLKLHLDGARIFNALVETGETPQQTGPLFDSISVCLSKGLGAPVGSLLISDGEFIRQARRVRKVMGGGMRQAGYLAAAGIYALDHHIARLREDNDHARALGVTLHQCGVVENIRPIQTNIVIFDVKPPFTAASFLEKLAEQQIKASAFGPQTVRLVTHLDFIPEMLAYTRDVLKQIAS